MNKEENLYQIIFKTILNNINKQNQQQNNNNNNNNSSSDDDDEDDISSQFSEKIVNFNLNNNNIISLLQRIIITNKDIWSWNHFFSYLLNSSSSSTSSSNNNNSNNNGNSSSSNKDNNSTNNNNDNTTTSNKIFILKLNKELQIELLNWFLTLLRCINNENSPSENIIIPIRHLHSFIIKSYIRNNEGYSIYKKDYLFSFIIDSILSDISLLKDTKYNNNNNNNSSSNNINNNSNQISGEEIEEDQLESNKIYYPFTIYYEKEFDRLIDESIDKFNKDINKVNKKDEMKVDGKEEEEEEEQKMKMEQGDDIQVYNYYSNNIIELVQSEFGSNRLSSIMGIGSNKEFGQNPYRYQVSLNQKKGVSTKSGLVDNQLVNDLELDDIIFINQDQQQQQHQNNQDELHLKDWSTQFENLIPEFNNIQLDIESMFKNGINYRSDPIIYNTGGIGNNDNMTIAKDIQDEDEDEDNIKSSLEQKESTTTTTTTITTGRKLENEEITPIIQIKEYIKSDNNISSLKELLEPLLLVSDIGEAIKLLEADTYSEDQFIHFMSTIISLDFSFLSLSQFFSTLLLPKALDIKSKTERGFLDLLGNCFKQHHTSFIGSFMVPLIVRNDEFHPPQKEIIIKLLQIKDIDNSIKVQFVSSLLSSIQKNHQFIWNESVIWVFTTIIQLKLTLNEKILSDLFEVLTIASKSLSKNQKFATLMLTTISSYQKNIKEFVPKIEQLLSNMQINVKGSLILLDKIKNS